MQTICFCAQIEQKHCFAHKTRQMHVLALR